MLLDTWGAVLQDSFQTIWLGVAEFVPGLVIALIIFLVGWAIGGILGRIVTHIVKAIRVDAALRGARIDTVLKRAGFRLDSGEFLGALVKWFIIIVFLVAAFDVLGLTQVNEFLRQVVLLYLPQVIVAVLILLAAALIADAMQRLVVGAAQAADISSANLLGTLTHWAIWIFAILMALFQLGIAQPFVQTIFTGVVVALSLGFGLAFGLGGQEAAASFIERVRKEVTGGK